MKENYSAYFLCAQSDVAGDAGAAGAAAAVTVAFGAAELMDNQVNNASCVLTYLAVSYITDD